MSRSFDDETRIARLPSSTINSFSSTAGSRCSSVDAPDAAPTYHHERRAQLQLEREARFRFDCFRFDRDERRCFFITGEVSHILDESDQAYRRLIECVHPLSTPPLAPTAAHRGSLEFEQACMKGGGVTTASSRNMVTKKESGPSSLSERDNRGSPTTTARDDINDSEEDEDDGDEDDGDESDNLDASSLSPNGHHPIINSIMKEFCAWWDAQSVKVGLRTAGAGQQETGFSCSQADLDDGHPSRPSQRAPAHRPLKRKRDTDGGEGGSDGEDGEDEDPGGLNQQSISLRKFACPFFKRNPGRFAQERACRGPGWDEVHRVKAHIYSRHGPLTHCPRCHSPFDTDTLRDEHLQQDPICTRVEGINLQQLDRITPQQKAALMRRTRLPATTTERKGERVWRQIYNILFPDETIPNPYHDPNDMAQGPWDLCLRMQRDTPHFVRRLLEDAFSPVLQQMQGEVRDVWHQVRDRLPLSLGNFYEALQNEGHPQPGPLHQQPGQTVNLRSRTDDLSNRALIQLHTHSTESPMSSADTNTMAPPVSQDAATQTLYTETQGATGHDTSLEHLEHSQLPDFQYQHESIVESGSTDDAQTSSGLMLQYVHLADLHTSDGYDTRFDFLNETISPFLQMPKSG